MNNERGRAGSACHSLLAIFASHVSLLIFSFLSVAFLYTSDYIINIALYSPKNAIKDKKRSFCSLSLWIHHIEEKCGALIPSALRGPQLNERALRRQPKLLITHRHSIPRLFNSPGCQSLYCESREQRSCKAEPYKYLASFIFFFFFLFSRLAKRVSCENIKTYRKYKVQVKHHSIKVQLHSRKHCVKNVHRWLVVLSPGQADRLQRFARTSIGCTYLIIAQINRIGIRILFCNAVKSRSGASEHANLNMLTAPTARERFR